MSSPKNAKVSLSDKEGGRPQRLRRFGGLSSFLWGFFQGEQVIDGGAVIFVSAIFTAENAASGLEGGFPAWKGSGLEGEHRENSCLYRDSLRPSYITGVL